MKLVYVQGMKGPQPQLWHEHPTNGAGARNKPLQEIELTLDVLAKAFPYQQPKKDASTE